MLGSLGSYLTLAQKKKKKKEKKKKGKEKGSSSLDHGVALSWMHACGSIRMSMNSAAAIVSSSFLTSSYSLPIFTLALWM
jgi:hypothetical protein